MRYICLELKSNDCLWIVARLLQLPCLLHDCCKIIRLQQSWNKQDCWKTLQLFCRQSFDDSIIFFLVVVAMWSFYNKKSFCCEYKHCIWCFQQDEFMLCLCILNPYRVDQSNWEFLWSTYLIRMLILIGAPCNIISFSCRHKINRKNYPSDFHHSGGSGRF